MFADAPEIRYALLWDVPRLNQLAHPGADAFVKAFGAAPLQEPEDRGDVLSLAAAGVVADRTGEGGKAQAIYRDIGGDYWEDLLRMALEGWSPSVEGSASISEAAKLVRALPTPSDLRALLTVKLATFACDKQDAPLFEWLLREALAATRANTRLRGVLQMEVMNFLGEFQPLPERFGHLPESRLVDRSWIDDWALAGSQKYMSQLLSDRARGPWSTVFRAGRQPLDEVVASEVQVTWAGALWQRRALRRQLGGQVLFGDPPDAQQAAFGLFFWFDGGGKDLINVSDLVEPKMDQAGIDWLVHSLASRIGPESSVAHRLTEGCIAFWDCLSSALIPLLLERLTPAPGDHPLLSDIRRLWSLFSVREPDAWTAYFLRLDEPAQLSMVDALGPTALRALTPQAAQRLLTFLQDTPEKENQPERAWLARAVLESRLWSPQDLEPFDLHTASPTVVVELARDFPERVPVSATRGALRMLIDQLEGARQEAKEGKFGIGTHSVAALVATGAIALDGDDAAIAALWTSALDDKLASHLRFEALLALGEAAALGLTDPSRHGELRDAAFPEGGFEFFGVDREAIEAARLLALSTSLEPSDEVRLLALSRGREARAREIAVRAAGIALDRSESERLEQVLLTALFDPEESVIRRSLEVLGRRHYGDSDVQAVIDSRLGELLDTRRRRVREEVASAARKWTMSGAASPDLERIIAQAAGDKSYRVRDAATT